MFQTPEQLDAAIAEAEGHAADIETLLAQTAGWDDVDPDAIAEFIKGPDDDEDEDYDEESEEVLNVAATNAAAEILSMISGVES